MKAWNLMGESAGPLPAVADLLGIRDLDILIHQLAVIKGFEGAKWLTNKTQIIITARDETRAAFQSSTASLGNLEKSAIGLSQYSPGWCCAHIRRLCQHHQQYVEVRGCARRYVGSDWRFR